LVLILIGHISITEANNKKMKTEIKESWNGNETKATIAPQKKGYP